MKKRRLGHMWSTRLVTLAVSLCLRLGQGCTDSGATAANDPATYCEVTAPPCVQEFDNTANGGTAKDAFIIYKIGEGKKDFPLSSNFVETDAACEIRYSLLLSGTSTEANTDYPALSLTGND